MQRKERRNQQFSEELTKFMERAALNDIELSRRIAVAPLTVRRWRRADNLPGKEMIRRIGSGLHWVDRAGVVRELTEEEVRKLMDAAGHLGVPPKHEAEDEIIHARCAVYSYLYSPEKFPSRWSSRIIELEESNGGSIYTMWNGLPSITRPPEFYEGAHQVLDFDHSDPLYDDKKVRAYKEKHKERQEDFEKRLRAHRVQHLYSIEGVDSYLKGTYLDSVDKKGHLGDEPWRPSSGVLKEQVANVLRWLERYSNFEVRLRQGPVAGNVTVIGYDVVLVEFPRIWQRMPMEAVHGLEIPGPEVVRQYMKQFDSFWADEYNTISDREIIIQWLTDWYKSLTKETVVQDVPAPSS